ERSPNPAARLAYAAFLARRKQVTQALEICEQAWAKCDPELVADQCLGILAVAPTHAETLPQGERQIPTPLATHPPPPPLPPSPCGWPSPTSTSSRRGTPRRNARTWS